MKNIIYMLVSILTGLSLVVGAAAASPEPPRPDRPERPQSGVWSPAAVDAIEAHRRGIEAGETLAPRPVSQAAARRAAVALGQPGTFFRTHSQIGLNDHPYPASSAYLNGPYGLAIDAANNIYVVESEGMRVLRFNSAGAATLTLGVAGVPRWNQSDFLAWPEDVAVDANGDIWTVDMNRVMRFSSAGVFEMSFPELDISDECGSDNAHFCGPTGIAFGPGGRLFVSDYDNHRVQVFDLDVSGNLVYFATIGAGVAGTSNAHFNYPMKIAIDGAAALYVADSENYRVQKCQAFPPFTCATFHGVTGVPDDSPNHLNWTPGVSVDAANNVYIADSGNWRVKRCSSTGVCADFTTDVSDPQDAVVDTLGNVYIAEYYNTYRVSKFNSSGVRLGTFAGVSGQPYQPHPGMISTPFGVAVDNFGNIYASESRGNRWLKYNPAGMLVWSLGEAGIRLNDPAHFGDALIGNPGIGGGFLYLPAGNQRCVRVYNLDGVYLNQTIGQCQGQTGDSGALLGSVGGVAFSPFDGRVYVVDRGNNKVKIYAAGSLVYQGLLGEGQSLGFGSGNYQFKYPVGIAIDLLGNVYVSDRDNHRVQKYNRDGVYLQTLGQTGVCEWTFDYLCYPNAVAVDRQNRVYVTGGFQRIQVFTPDGAYLTTIGGEWGGEPGSFRNPQGVAVASDGTVVVTDRDTHRIQKFLPGPVRFVPVNLNGFATPANGNVHTLAAFGSQLYAGTYNSDDGGQIWKLDPASGWSMAAAPGFGNPLNTGINHLVEYGGKLYAGVRRDDPTAGQVWRSDDGAGWGSVASGGFNDANNFGVYRLQGFNGNLYAGTANNTGGAAIFRSDSGDVGTWAPVVAGGFNNDDNTIFRTSAVHNGELYFASQNINNATWNSSSGAIIIRSSSGDSGSWASVMDNGFGDVNNAAISGLTSFNGYLYAATSRWDWAGVEVWRCQVCSAQADWEQVVDNGFGSINNWGQATLQVYAGSLYLALGNYYDGMEVWRSASGASGEWERLVDKGFGDRTNNSPYYNSLAVFNDSLYLGVQNGAKGAGVWIYQSREVFLPLMTR